MVQANSITDSFFTAFGVPQLVTGIVIAILAGVIFLGGVKTLASVTEKIVPLMAVIYVAGCLIILILRIESIPSAWIEMGASLITQEDLPGEGESLSDTAPSSYGDPSELVTSPWIRDAIGY